MPLFLVLLVGACGEPTGPERRSILGHWVSRDFAPATIEMTLTEVARSVDGAGRLVSPDAATAFGVSGAHAEGSVSLLFEFEAAPDVNFLGEFEERDVLVGTLVGGGFLGVPITFVRVEDG